MGAVLQPRVQNAWQPLAFFSRKLSPAQQKYSAYDRELLAIYEAVKHFRHMLEARHFIIFTDHKPLTYAFEQKRDKCSPRQFNHLDYISQFTTDIRHIPGQHNVVADALSRVEAISACHSRRTGLGPRRRRRTPGTPARAYGPTAGETPDSWHHRRALL
jgi:cleavage and polyadenylation specificity factor subunit 1